MGGWLVAVTMNLVFFSVKMFLLITTATSVFDGAAGEPTLPVSATRVCVGAGSPSTTVDGGGGRRQCSNDD